MSQVVKALKAVDTGDRRLNQKGMSPLFTNTFDVKTTISETPPNFAVVAKRYRIEAKIGAETWIEDRPGQESITEAINRTKRQVVEAIFGEFRQDIRVIEKAIYDYNMEEAGQLLYKLERKMFEDTE